MVHKWSFYLLEVFLKDIRLASLPHYTRIQEEAISPIFGIKVPGKGYRYIPFLTDHEVSVHIRLFKKGHNFLPIKIEESYLNNGVFQFEIATSVSFSVPTSFEESSFILLSVMNGFIFPPKLEAEFSIPIKVLSDTKSDVEIPLFSECLVYAYTTVSLSLKRLTQGRHLHNTQTKVQDVNISSGIQHIHLNSKASATNKISKSTSDKIIKGKNPSHSNMAKFLKTAGTSDQSTERLHKCKSLFSNYAYLIKAKTIEGTPTFLQKPKESKTVNLLNTKREFKYIIKPRGWLRKEKYYLPKTGRTPYLYSTNRTFLLRSAKFYNDVDRIIKKEVKHQLEATLKAVETKLFEVTAHSRQTRPLKLLSHLTDNKCNENLGKGVTKQINRFVTSPVINEEQSIKIKEREPPLELTDTKCKNNIDAKPHLAPSVVSLKQPNFSTISKQFVKLKSCPNLNSSAHMEQHKISTSKTPSTTNNATSLNSNMHVNILSKSMLLKADTSNQKESSSYGNSAEKDNSSQVVKLLHSGMNAVSSNLSTDRKTSVHESRRTSSSGTALNSLITNKKDEKRRGDKRKISSSNSLSHNSSCTNANSLESQKTASRKSLDESEKDAIKNTDKEISEISSKSDDTVTDISAKIAAILAARPQDLVISRNTDSISSYMPSDIEGLTLTDS